MQWRNLVQARFPLPNDVSHSGEPDADQKHAWPPRVQFMWLAPAGGVTVKPRITAALWQRWAPFTIVSVIM